MSHRIILKVLHLLPRRLRLALLRAYFARLDRELDVIRIACLTMQDEREVRARLKEWTRDRELGVTWDQAVGECIQRGKKGLPMPWDS
jgi:hypothetical protein